MFCVNNRAMISIIYFKFFMVDNDVFVLFRDLLKKISNVTIDDLKMVGEKYFVQLFDPSQFTATLCCHPTKIDEILKSFAE